MSDGISRRGWLGGVFAGLFAWLTRGGRTAKVAMVGKFQQEQVSYSYLGDKETSSAYDFRSGGSYDITTTYVYSADGESLHIKQEMPGPLSGSDGGDWVI